MRDSATLAYCILICFLVIILGGASFGQYKENLLRDACEAELPRNQSCVMVFIPEEMEND